MEIFYSSRFLLKYEKLPKEVKEKAEKQEKIFRKNPFDPRLKTHKLQRKLNKCWAFSIDFQYRIVFGFEDCNVIKFYSIGGHSIYS